jgi:hypothetical protein
VFVLGALKVFGLGFTECIAYVQVDLSRIRSLYFGV